MKLRRLAGMMVCVMLAGSLFGCDVPLKDKLSKDSQTTEEMKQPTNIDEWMDYFGSQSEQKEIVCWYSDVNDKDWLEMAGQDFEKEYGKSVSFVQYDGVQMFEDMNRANQEGKGPDLYIAGNDQMELAVTAALVQENPFSADSWKEYYPEVTKTAATYKGKQYGYPIYFDTYCLVYDANLLENAPASIDDILAFADEYEDTGSTKAIFRWDVADPYINTMFVNSYSDLFGENGDDSTSFKINSDKSVEAMEYFKSLSAYLWMNKSNISHDTVKNRIQEGTLVLGLCKSDILDVLSNGDTIVSDESESAEQNENTEQSENIEQNEEKDNTNYKVSYVPSLTSELSSDSFSTTYLAYVNPYGNNDAVANQFAMYLSLKECDKQYSLNHKLPVVDQKDKFNDAQSVFYGQYLNSKPVPKVIVLGDYLAESGITYDAIWGGGEVKEQLDLLQQKMEEKLSK